MGDKQPPRKALSALRSRVCAALAVAAYIGVLLNLVQAQQLPDGSNDAHGMVATGQGLLAIGVPPGWVQRPGPGLAYFVLASEQAGNSSVSIDITSARIGVQDSPKELSAAMKADIARFNSQNNSAIIREEKSLALPGFVRPAKVYSIESAVIPFAQVVYIEDEQRVWILTLAAQTREAFDRALPAFHAFAASYQGSIQY